MKIYTFTTVKDEEDIIESFVRYHMNFVDGMIISDNYSNDSTLSILKKLKQEGLNIDILEDHNQYFDQNKKRKELFDYTFNKYNPDFIFPIDSDEFIATYDGTNPRDIIKNLDKTKLFHYKMVNYVINKNDDKNELFIPLKMQHIRIEDTKEGNTYKCFIPNKIINKNLVLLMGCHSAKYINDDELEYETLDNLFLAHYPVRSKKQLMNKVIIGRLNNSSLHSRKEGLGFHQYEILDEIIKNGDISDKTLNEISKNYGIKDKKKIKKIVKSPLNVAFCKNIDIKYYNYNNSNLLSNTIKASETIIDHMREKYNENNSKYLKISKEFKKLLDEYNEIINSKRWKFICKISNIKNIFKK